MSRQVRVFAPSDVVEGCSNDQKQQHLASLVQLREKMPLANEPKNKGLSMRMSLPNPASFHHRPNHMHLTMSSEGRASSEERIPMVDDCPTPNLMLRAGYIPLPFGNGQNAPGKKSDPGGAMEHSLTSSSYYSEEEEKGHQEVGASRRRIKLLKGRRIPMQLSAAAQLCRRGSPPIAQSELLSESEISDLEQQIASGRLARSFSGTSMALKEFLEEDKSTEGENILKCEEEEVAPLDERTLPSPEEEEATEEEAHRQKDEEWNSDANSGDGGESSSSHSAVRRDNNNHDSNNFICVSSSMPAIASSNSYWGSGYVPADFWQSEYPADDEPWEEGERKKNIMHRSLNGQNELDGRRRRRRMLPLRPDQRRSSSPRDQDHRQEEQEESVPATSPPSLAEQQLRQVRQSSFSAKQRRQLPRIPSSDDPLDKIDIASTTKEYLLSVLNHGGHRREKERRGDAYFESDMDGREEPVDPEDFSPMVPILPSPSTIQRPDLPLSMMAARNGNHHSHKHHSHHHHQNEMSDEYKLSYGMDRSVLKHARRELSIEGSFYEDVDGLNGNLTGGFYGRDQRGWDTSEDLFTPDDEGERRRASNFNIVDGNKSSSGISSSCCTTSSRSCEAAENGTFPLRRQQRGGQAKSRRREPSDPRDPTAPTHRAQFPFMPRHGDEIELERGDALHITEKCDDHWCCGTNLRTGKQGIFPEAHIVEIDLVDEICRSVLPDNASHQSKHERDTFYLTMLASVEVAHHKGNDVLVQAINKVCSMYQQKEEILVPQTILMEVSFRGIHLIDKRKRDIFRCPTFDFFYSLQNISFCGAHPKELRYFGFITKHPLLPRFACHVFLSAESTQPIVEAIGRAFKRSYDEYMAFAHPTEDIFID